MVNTKYKKEEAVETVEVAETGNPDDASLATKKFNEQHKKLVEDGDVERIDENIPKPEYEKKTKRWFGEKNHKL